MAVLFPVYVLANFTFSPPWGKDPLCSASQNVAVTRNKSRRQSNDRKWDGAWLEEDGLKGKRVQKSGTIRSHSCLLQSLHGLGSPTHPHEPIVFGWDWGLWNFSGGGKSVCTIRERMRSATSPSIAACCRWVLASSTSSQMSYHPQCHSFPSCVADQDAQLDSY